MKFNISHENIEYGPDCKISSFSNLYGCKLGRDVFVGPFCEIQKNVTIGENTRIQSHSFICEFVDIGSNCFIGHGVIFTNDLFTIDGPARGDTSKYSSTFIGNNVSIGSGVTFLPVKVVDNVVIGAGSVVTKDLLLPGIYAGNPAKLLRSR